MIGAADLDAMTDEEFLAYLAALDDAQKPRTPEQLWRTVYREQMCQKRIVGYQPDLFGADPVTHFRRHRPAADFPRPPIESPDDKLTRIEGDPLAAFGPPRADALHICRRTKKRRS